VTLPGLEEAPCIENAGIADAGIEDVGIGDVGIDNVGIENAGIVDVGIENAGIERVGIENEGIENAGIGDDGIEDVVISADVAMDGTLIEGTVIDGAVMLDVPPRLWAWAACPSVRVAATMLTRIALIVSVLRSLKPLDETNSPSIVIQAQISDITQKITQATARRRRAVKTWNPVR
jgi:pentapeptide repeat protein